MSTHEKCYCFRCTKDTEHEFRFSDGKFISICKECLNVVSSQERILFTLDVLTSKYLCPNCNVETLYYVLIDNKKRIVLFCTSCGREVRTISDYSEICGFLERTCPKCRERSRILMYLSSNKIGHFLCIKCAEDSELVNIRECIEIRSNTITREW